MLTEKVRGVTDPQRRLVLSIKPRFVAMILDGSKSIELRRVRPKVDAGCPVLIYASSPQRSLLGCCTIARVVNGAPSTIWRKYGRGTGLRRREFDDYFSGCRRATALVLSDVLRLDTALPLTELRKRWAGFEPPQSFRYAHSHWEIPIARLL